MDEFIMLQALGDFITAASVSVIGSVSLGYYAVDRKLSNDDQTFIKIESMPQEFVRDHRKCLETAGLKKEVVDVAEEFVGVTSKLGVNLDSFYSNFNRYSIIIDYKKSRKWKVMLEPEDRELMVNSKNLRENLLYGFLLLSGTSLVDDVSAIGFSRAKKDEYRIGHGLTKGYVDNFLKWHFLNPSVESQVMANLAHFVENIVGSEVMKSAFFKGALEDIIEALAKYSSVTDATIVVREIDHVNVAAERSSLILDGLSLKVYRDVVYRLTDMYIKKMREEDMDVPENLARDVMLLSDMLERRAPLISPLTYHVSKKDKTIAFKKLDNELKSHNAPSILE